VGRLHRLVVPEEATVYPKPYPPEFRRQAMDLVGSGRTDRNAAASLGIGESCLHGWKSRDMIDRGLRPGITSSESAELAAAHRLTRELEEENPQ
jgi:transposase-like protein